MKKLLNLFASSSLELYEGRTSLPFSPMRFLVSLNDFLWSVPHSVIFVE